MPHTLVARSMTILFLFQMAMLADAMNTHFRTFKVMGIHRRFRLTCGARSIIEKRKGPDSRRPRKGERERRYLIKE
jgi:hypothetical protein